MCMQTPVTSLVGGLAYLQVELPKMGFTKTTMWSCSWCFRQVWGCMNTWQLDVAEKWPFQSTIHLVKAGLKSKSSLGDNKPCFCMWNVPTENMMKCHPEMVLNSCNRCGDAAILFLLHPNYGRQNRNSLLSSFLLSGRNLQHSSQDIFCKCIWNLVIGDANFLKEWR